MSQDMTAPRTKAKRSAARLAMTRETRHASCRAMGHEWHHGKPIGIDDPGDFRRPFGSTTGMLGLPSTCAMCGGERIRWVTRSGEVITRYAMPEGYARHGDERLTSQEWRSSYVTTLFDSFDGRVAR